MDWLILQKQIKELEPFITIGFGFISFASGFVGGMLRQKYAEGAIKGEIDSKFAYTEEKIAAINDRLTSCIESSINDIYRVIATIENKQIQFESIQAERLGTKQAEILLSVKDLLMKEFQQLDERLQILRERARAEKAQELIELKTYVDHKFDTLLTKELTSK